MNQHAEYTMLMSLALDGEACEDEEQRLREHLRSCDACRATWQRWRELDRRLAYAPLAPAPVDFAALVLAQLDTRVAQERRHRWLITSLAVATIAATAIAIVALLIFNGMRIQPEQGALAAAWAGLVSVAGWVIRAGSDVVALAGAPAVAAVTGALLCLTLALTMTWLWVVARLHGTSALAVAE